ncbi:hypothetical protein EVAR_94033_1 [Eumeta japonica]|uniref:DUF4781 domain-containing protein n=1 Tax=Eumeta variegata TaxID=151549 RepID=A0A4C1V6U5_EUMVA|nr:hypothetical protein EVAR_94033_1 [Eumeta japonica]
MVDHTKLSPQEIQQLYFENLNDCDWVRYEKKDRKHLIQNIAFALFGSPSIEGELEVTDQHESVNLEGYQSRQKEQVLKVYEKLCEQCKYSENKEDIVMSVLLVVCARPKPLDWFQIEPSDHWVDLHIKRDIDIWCTAVFKIRKCIPTVANAKPCRVYVDDSGRVYRDWNSYLTDNVQPKCVLIVPEDGEYTGILNDENIAVSLTVVPAPSLGLTAKVLSTADVASTAASLGALGVVGAAMFTPVGPAVLVGATVATVTTGVYGLVRSSMHLHDRRTHEQTIDPRDSEARNSWINIAASSVALTAGAASTLLSRSAAAGANLTRTGRALALSVDVLRHANILTGGAGVINSLAHIINKYRDHGEKPTALEIFQFTSATLFFCNAVMSNRTAQNIIEDAQTKTINEYRATLRSNRHRKIFDKISAEPQRVKGSVLGKTEVIKGIQAIENKDEYFASVLRINKDVNQNKLRISMTADGKVNINAQHKFNPSELYGMGREGRNDLFKTLGPDCTTARNVPTRLISPYPSTVRDGQKEECHSNIITAISPNEMIQIGSFFIRVSMEDTESISVMLEEFSETAHANFMTICLNLVSRLVPQEITKIKLLHPEKDILSSVAKFVFNYLKDKKPLGVPCPRTGNPIDIALIEFFQNVLFVLEKEGRSNSLITTKFSLSLALRHLPLPPLPSPSPMPSPSPFPIPLPHPSLSLPLPKKYPAYSSMGFFIFQ